MLNALTSVFHENANNPCLLRFPHCVPLQASLSGFSLSTIVCGEVKSAKKYLKQKLFFLWYQSAVLEITAGDR